MLAGQRLGRSSVLALTMGDPAGIGLEITLKAWLARVAERLPPFVFFGCKRSLERAAARLGYVVSFATVTHPGEAFDAFAMSLPVIDVPLRHDAVPGAPNVGNAGSVITAIERATAAVFAGEVSAVVTNPIAKSVLTAAGFGFPGHTEFLAHLAAVATGAAQTPVMMLAARELRVVPLTIHIPLADVARAIKPDNIIATLRIMHQALAQDFGIKAPRIAVAGLNPHAGEGGTMGFEEIELIMPALARVAREGILVTGPHPADTLFHAERRASYDAVLAMYHDQALIPIKTLAFDRGVNTTLGLPFVRTSPDHGTAFDIAAHGTASATSLIEALRLAGTLSRARRLRELAGAP